MSKLRFAAVLVAGLITVAGCGGDNASRGGADAEAPLVSGSHDGMQHVHGLGVSANALFIATHTGLWTAPEGHTKAHRVGGSRQDIMGFSVVSDGHFIGSGHPDPSQSDLPPDLGLIESSDAGQSWRSISLLGQADFHVLETAARTIYGVNSADGGLMVSNDTGHNWQKRTPPAGVFSLAVDPRSPQRIIASTERGVFSSADGGEGWRPVRNDRAGLIAWPERDRLYLVDGKGDVQLSEDGGHEWRPAGRIGGQPAAFIAHGNDLYVALTDATVKRSTDGGRLWTLRAAP
jgi:hypothetical protein